MPTLLLSARQTDDAQLLWRACIALGWDVVRVQGWRVPAMEAKSTDHLPHEAGLKLLSIPRAPKEMPVSALIRNAHGVAEWKLFLKGQSSHPCGQ